MARLSAGVVTVGLLLSLGPGPALAQTLDLMSSRSELGSDFRISTMGPAGNTAYDADMPAVAWDSANNRFLVVWSGAEDVVGEEEIWGQVVDADTGSLVGSDFQISFVGPADDPARDAEDPAVAYNSATGEFLVVWSADHYADGDFEIFGRRVNASTQALVGSMVRVSVMGPGVDPDYDATEPAVAYNHVANQYLVVWSGDEGTAPLVDNEMDIWGQTLDASAEKVGSQFKISSMGAVGSADWDAYAPDLAFNGSMVPVQFLVVWHGDDSTDNEYEIWAQRVLSSGGLLGAEVQVSEAGTPGVTSVSALRPAVAYDSVDNEYLVVWDADVYFDELQDIFGQRLDAETLAEVGADDFFISNPGDGLNESYDALRPDVSYDSIGNEYFVVWQDDEIAVGEFEIWGQRVNASTGASIDGDTRLSDMGTDLDPSRVALTAAVAWSQGTNLHLAVWSGDDAIDGEHEVWGQRFVTPLIFADGFETATATAWSDVLGGP